MLIDHDGVGAALWSGPERGFFFSYWSEQMPNHGRAAVVEFKQLVVRYLETNHPYGWGSRDSPADAAIHLWGRLSRRNQWPIGRFFRDVASHSNTGLRRP